MLNTEYHEIYNNIKNFTYEVVDSNYFLDLDNGENIAVEVVKELDEELHREQGELNPFVDLECEEREKFFRQLKEVKHYILKYDLESILTFVLLENSIKNKLNKK